MFTHFVSKVNPNVNFGSLQLLMAMWELDINFTTLYIPIFSYIEYVLITRRTDLQPHSQYIGYVCKKTSH